MIGHTLLHYKILEKVGEGGMGIVYKAYDSRLEREVAIKFLPRPIAASLDERNRFMIEAKAAAALNHPNIATIHAIEEAKDMLFIVMEYIEGQELKALLGERALSIKEAMDYALQILKGLSAAHQKGIIHRDIKPSNILITKDGQVKIMDFGLAKIGTGDHLTQIGTTLGTVAYMSPEQARGDDVSILTDIWSFGVVFYEMLTGHLPFQHEYEQALLYSILHEDPLPASNFHESISDSVEYILNKCLKKETKERYHSSQEIETELKRVLHGEALTDVRISKNYLRIPAIGFTRKLSWIHVGILILVLFVGIILPLSWQKIMSWSEERSMPNRQHLAILPFSNISDDEKGKVLCDGLLEVLTSKLTKLENAHTSLWIVPASEVRRYKVKSPGEARQSFGVNLVVSGSLQIINDMMRLNLNLINARTMRQLNSSVIDVNKNLVLALQDETVNKVIEMLNLELHPHTTVILKAGETTVPGAYEFYLQGRGYLQRHEDMKNIDSAIRLFQKATEIDNKFALAWAGLGEAYWRKFENSKESTWAEKAIEVCEKARHINNQLAAVNITLGIIHSGTGKYSKAIEDFDRALNIEPTNSDAYRGLAKAYEMLNRLTDAELTYKKSIEMKSDYWAGYNELGIFYFRNGRYEDAIQQFQQVIALTPDNYRGYNNLGSMYYLMERWPEARQMFEHSFRIKKTYGATSNLATLYFIEGQYEKAARMYEKALEFNKSDYLIWGNLASTYNWIPAERHKARSIFLHAIKLAEKKLKINPNDPEVLSRLANYYSMVDEPEKARRMIEIAQNLAPKNVQVMYRSGTTYEALGERAKAIEWIVKAIKHGQSESEIKNQPELKGLIGDNRFHEALISIKNN